MDPWLGSYQNVPLEGSEAYLTDHQREQLETFRQHHQPGGLWFALQQRWTQASEQTGLLLRRAGGDHRDYEPLQPFTNALRNRKVRVALFSLLGVLGALLVVSLFRGHAHGRGGGGGGGYPSGPHDVSEVSKALRPLPASRDRCKDLRKMPAPPGQRYLQILNMCSGTTVWPGMIGAGGGAVPPPEGGWQLDPGTCKTITVPSRFPSIRLWGRTGCNNATTPGEFKCQTGNCVTNGDLSCTSAASVATLYEATLQGACPQEGQQLPGSGPDFYDLSVVDGYNLPMSVQLVGGVDVPNTPQRMSCIDPIVHAMTVDDCPFELRRYSDQLPGWDVPLASVEGKNVEVSPCFRRPLDPACRRKFNGCNSICKAWDEGWIAFYIDSVVGPENEVDPYIQPLAPKAKRIRWSQQFLQGRQNCSMDGCRDQPAFGAYRRGVYGDQGHTMKDLVCCAGTFFCSPFQPNNSPGCSYTAACPTLGAGDPQSRFHARMYGKDLAYPQVDQDVRMSTSQPDWPLATSGKNYAALYKGLGHQYTWQYDDGADSLFLCCGQEDKNGGSKGPHYKITFCPSG